MHRIQLTPTGSLACSPFHVRFGKFSLLRPYEKKVKPPLINTLVCHCYCTSLTVVQVEFRVNNVKQPHAMKLGEGGEAFFVFETSDNIPESLQTSPVISPTTSPHGLAAQNTSSGASWQEPEYLDLGSDAAKKRPEFAVYQEDGVSIPRADKTVPGDIGMITFQLYRSFGLILCRNYNAFICIPTRVL